MILVNLVCYARFKGDRRKLRGTGHGHLNRKRAVRLQEVQFEPRQRPNLAQSRGDDSRHTADRSAGGLARLPTSSHGIGQVKPFHRIGEITHEIPPAEFSVGHDIKPQLFLFGKNAQDMLIFQLANLLCACPAPRFKQFGGPQEASDVLGSVCSGHTFHSATSGLDAFEPQDTACGVVAPFPSSRAELIESLAAISVTKAIFCANSFARNRCVGPAIPTAAITRSWAPNTGAATPLRPRSSS